MNTDSIQKSILLRAPRKRIWRALTDSTEFGLWFGMRFDGPFIAGTSIRGVIVPTTVDPEVANAQKPYEGFAVEIGVEKIEPERLFSLHWHPYAVDPNFDYSAEPMTLIVFELHEAADGTLLTVTESGFDQIPASRRSQAFAANEQGWSMVVKLIEGYLIQAP